jgi:tetratricopeptide (TPR) repeat protein
LKNRICTLKQGLSLDKLGKYNEASSYYNIALAINPKFLVTMKEKDFTLAAAEHNAKSTMTKKP